MILRVLPPARSLARSCALALFVALAAVMFADAGSAGARSSGVTTSGAAR